MANSRKQDFFDDHGDQSNGEDFSHSSPIDVRSISSSDVEESSAGSSRVVRQDESSGSETGLGGRLTDVLVNGGDGDLLLQSNDREDKVLQWLQALDMQVIGACRADERLKPLLKLNVSNGMAEDRLLVHLSQHFEPAEVGILARCFCIPLVSIRVGKINKRGSLMCPTATRGNLSLTLLPTSDLRLSFIGDNGQSERLFTFSSKSQCSAVSIEEIASDNSGRSFVVEIPDGRAFYYWCSEKSKLLGNELLMKMNDLIRKKPSISELTGIDESRLGCFATRLCFSLTGLAVSSIQATSAGGSSSSLSRDSLNNAQCPSMPSRPLRSRHCDNQATKSNSFYQGSLSPKSSSFKENTPRNSSLRIASRDKLRRRSDGHLSAFDNLTITSTVTTEASSFSSIPTENEIPRDTKSCPLASHLAESRLKLTSLPTFESQLPLVGPPIFSPHYCWCPPNASSLHQSTASQYFPTPSIGLPFPSLPPLSSLLPASVSPGLFAPTPPLDLADIPPLLPDPLVRLPISSSHQIPTFIPLMCDPIVHIPIIDVCSSGQGYFVSAGPAISTSIPPLHPNLVNPVLPENESLVEKGARETLRLLISSSNHSNPPLIDVLTKAEERQSIFVAGSRGLYSGIHDVDTVVGGVSTISLFAPLGPLPSLDSCDSSSSSDPDVMSEEDSGGVE